LEHGGGDKVRGRVLWKKVGNERLWEVGGASCATVQGSRVERAANLEQNEYFEMRNLIFCAQIFEMAEPDVRQSSK
jgi:hypothetical protein